MHILLLIILLVINTQISNIFCKNISLHAYTICLSIDIQIFEHDKGTFKSKNYFRTHNCRFVARHTSLIIHRAIIFHFIFGFNIKINAQRNQNALSNAILLLLSNKKYIKYRYQNNIFSFIIKRNIVSRNFIMRLLHRIVKAG